MKAVVQRVKNADDNSGTVLRMFEAFKETKQVTLRFAEKINAVFVCDMLENEERELSVVDGSVSFTIKPFEIVTLKVK